MTGGPRRSPGPRREPYGEAVSDRAVSRSRRVDAPVERVFALLSDPHQHVALDGSGTVRGVLRGPDRLGPGDAFWMRMRLVVPYVIRNVVVEHDEGRRLAWAHPGRHRWRWELEPDGDGTSVVHTFDWSTALAPAVLERFDVPAGNAKGMEGTLERLAAAVAPAQPAG